MNVSSLKNLVRDWIIAKALANITAENLKSVFEQVIIWLREYAEKSDNKIDDWCIDGVEYVLKDEKKLEIICDFIRVKITGNVCNDTCGLDWYEYNLLAKDLMDEERVPCDTCASSIISVFSVLASVLQVVVPVIIDIMKAGKE